MLDFCSSENWTQDVSHKRVHRIQSISDSNICKDVYERAYIANLDVKRGELVFLMGLILSDDFDSKSFIKANRGAV